MELAHEEEYAGHPILRLFTRPEEMENGPYMCMMPKEDIEHMNGASGKKLTHDTLHVVMTLHERHAFHLVAVATDGAKGGEPKTGWNLRGCRRPHMERGKDRNQRRYSETNERRRRLYKKG
eukprot:6189874-Pleurochrysis_carterae.AAC.2